MRLSLLSLSFILVVVGCSTSMQQRRVVQGQAFGTTYTIQYDSERNDEEEVQKGIDSVIYVMNKSMSTYLPQSDISRINAGDSTVVIDAMFREVFMLSRKLNQQSGGYFDPTIGVLRNAYGFGDVQPLESIDQLTLDSLMQYVGWHKVALKEGGTIKKESPEIYFDFNAIAKGYGIDRIAAYFDKKEIANYLIELGGELSARGTNSVKEQLWVVGVEKPDSPLEERTYGATLGLKDQAMAASGNYRKTRIDPISGDHYVHTINPLTGSAERSDILSAVVVAPSCALADAWATAFMAMGLERAKAVLPGLDTIEAYLIYATSSDTSKWEVYTTSGFEALLQD